MTSMKIIPKCMLCWNCGAKNDINDSFCHRCGEGLDNLQSKNQLLHNQELNTLQSNPDYTKVFYIKRTDFYSNKFIVFENNQ